MILKLLILQSKSKNSIIYAINVQNRSTPIANLTKALSFKTHNIDSIPQQLFEVIAPTINNRRLKKAQEIKQEQNRQRQEYIAQKQIVLIYIVIYGAFQI